MHIHEPAVFEQGAWQQYFAFGRAFPLGGPAVLAFLADLSQTVLKAPAARAYPDLITFGYFCRKASIRRALDTVPDGHRRFGWGTAVHIAPANIPLNFAFSFVMGLLAGNSALVRLPSKRFEQADLLLALMHDVLRRTPDLADAILFVRSERDSGRLDDLVARAQALIVWGGDRTVARFRALPKQPRCATLYFPDRVSSALVDAAGCLAMTDEEIAVQAGHFFNDSFLVDQNACSSPSIIFWLGTQGDIAQTKDRFWAAVEQVVAQRYQADPMAQMDRLIDLCRLVDAAGGPVVLDRGPMVWRLAGLDRTTAHQGPPLRYGIFREVHVAEVSDIGDYLRPHEQTLTTLGIKPEAVFDGLAAQAAVIGLDRIVPMGQALDMGVHWDGKNILSILSRAVQIG